MMGKEMFLSLLLVLFLGISVYASECDDGIDNDGDGLIDWQLDLGCYGPEDATEGGINFALDNGWTVFEPSSDTQIVYVSSSTGNDSWSGLAPEFNGSDGPKKTIDAGYEEMRDGYPDWLLLKRGDTFRDEDLGDSGSGLWLKDGKNRTHIMVISTYGNSAKRPRIINGGFTNGQGWQSDPAEADQYRRDYIGIFGIEFYQQTMDPNSENFTATSSPTVDLSCPGDLLYLEDLYSRFGGISVHAGGSGKSNVTIRRCIIRDSYSVSSGHAQGSFLSHIYNLTLEQNLYDSNGWNADFDSYIRPNLTDIHSWRNISDGRFRITVNGSSIDVDGVNLSTVDNLSDIAIALEDAINNAFGGSYIDATAVNDIIVFRGSFGTHPRVIDIAYFTAYNGSVEGTDIEGGKYLNGPGFAPDATQFNHNIYISSSSYVPGPDGGYRLIGNILSRGSASGVQVRAGGYLDNNLMLYNSEGGHYGRTSQTPVPKGVNGTFRRNVVMHSSITSGTDARGGVGFEFSHINTLVAEDNIFADEDIKLATGTVGITIGGAHEGIKNLTIRNNTVYKAGLCISSCCYEDDFNRSEKTVRVIGNLFQRYSGSSESSWDNRVLVMKHSDDDYSGHFDFENNTWWNDYEPVKWFNIGAFNTEMSLEEWTSHVGETGSSAKRVVFVDPDRNVSTYMASLGYKGTYDSFIEKAANQSRFNWHDEFTAAEVNEYIRKGFVVMKLHAADLNNDGCITSSEIKAYIGIWKRSGADISMMIEGVQLWKRRAGC